MKRLLAFLTATAFPATAEAADWILANSIDRPDTKYETYVDRDSISSSSDIFRSWSKKVFFNDKVYRSNVTTYNEYQCKSLKYRTLTEIIRYNNGNSEQYDTSKENKWNYINIDSPQYFEIKVTCGLPENTNKWNMIGSFESDKYKWSIFVNILNEKDNDDGNVLRSKIEFYPFILDEVGLQIISKYYVYSIICDERKIRQLNYSFQHNFNRFGFSPFSTTDWSFVPPETDLEVIFNHACH